MLVAKQRVVTTTSHPMAVCSTSKRSTSDRTTLAMGVRQAPAQQLAETTDAMPNQPGYCNDMPPSFESTPLHLPFTRSHSQDGLPLQTAFDGVVIAACIIWFLCRKMGSQHVCTEKCPQQQVYAKKVQGSAGMEACEVETTTAELAIYKVRLTVW